MEGIEGLKHFSTGLTLPVSLPSPDLIRGLTGQSSIPGRWLLDRPVKPGDDSTEYVNLIEKCSGNAMSLRLTGLNVRHQTVHTGRGLLGPHTAAGPSI